MPPWGRPPGGRGVGKYLEAEDESVYRFQELESDDEKNGVSLDQDFQMLPNGKQQSNPDELFFNDMDIRAWERRTAELDGLAYGDDYGYQEDEGYYDDAGDFAMSTAEYEELLFQRVLEKIRQARATGKADVQLSPEELDAYQARLYPRAPAAHPQAARARPVSTPLVNASTSSAVTSLPSSAGTSGSSNAKSKKSSRRTSLFSSRPKEKKPSGRSRAPSNVSEMTSQQLPPGFVVPGPNGQPQFAPINAYQGRMARDTPGRASDSRRSSRSASISSDRHPAKGNSAAHATRGTQQAQTPPRITPPRDMPGAFPSYSPQRYRMPTPPLSSRPASSSSRHSMQDNVEASSSRNRPSPVQQAPKLVPFPTTEYRHHSAEPFHYQMAGQLATPQSQPQYARRVVSGPADNYTAMPRRVPLPVQRATAVSGVHGSHSDPAIPQRGSRAEVSEDDADVLADVLQADDKSYKGKTGKSTGKESNGGSGRDSERRRKSGRSRRKN